MSQKKFQLCIFVFMLATISKTEAAPLTISADDAFHNRAYLVNIEQEDEYLSVEQQHRQALRPLPLKERTESLSFAVKTVNIAGQSITRSTLLIDDMPVEGVDAIFDNYGSTKKFSFTEVPAPLASFRLNVAEAIERAMQFNPESIIKDPYAERIDNIFDRLWVMHFGELRPAYKIRLPTLPLAALKDVYIDADNGRVLKIEDSAQFAQAPANVFVFSPPSPIARVSDLKLRILPNLVDVKEDGFLTGQYLSVRTCCRYYTCPAEGPCTDDKKRCALKSHENAIQTRELLSLPTDSLGLDALVSLPPVVHVDTVRCTYLPFARASKDQKSHLVGFFDKPIDEPGIESEMDRFSEIQAYFSIMSFFNHIRALLADKTWCLRSEAMSCNPDGTPVLDDQGLPKNPYRVFVNQLIPDMKLDRQNEHAPDNFIAQANAGRGTRENPIVLNDFVRFSNAAFVPALSTLKKNTPRADEILSDLIKPYDHNVFFQGDKDFAYDGLVVFHEFMHAVTTSLINKINSLGLDKWGINSEPGGLNEAWSDYFAAAFSNNSKMGEYTNVQNGYGEVAMRNIDNAASCPADVIGEIHNDGLIWSGSLWEIRSRIKNSLEENAVVEFDRAVLASLAQAKTTEDFKTQSEKLIANLRLRDGLLGPAVAIAEEVFKKRGVRDCFRAVTLSSVDKTNQLKVSPKSMLFVPSKNQIGLNNYAPSSAQLEIGIPAGARSMRLSFRQFLGATGALLGTEVTKDNAKNMIPLSVISHLTTPIVWQWKGATATPTDGITPLNLIPENTFFDNGAWHYVKYFNFDRCAQNTMYMSLLSHDFKYVLQNLTVSFDIDYSDNRLDCDFTGTMRGKLGEHANTSCQSHGIANSWLLMALLLLRYRSYKSAQLMAKTPPRL